jgi:hypothetical protein
MSVAATSAEPGPVNRGFCTPPSLAELIRNLYLEERSGTLILSRSGAEKRVWLLRGMILSASSSLEDERLPAFLVQRGLIRPEEADALRGLDDRQSGEALVGRGQVAIPAMRQVVRDLTQQILSAVFRWEDLEFNFEEGPVPVGLMESNVIVSFELIIRALRLMGGFDQVRDAMLRQERAIGLSDNPYLPLEQLGLTSLQGYLVSRIDGRTKARDILSLVPSADEESAARFLFGLLILDLAKFIPPIGPGLLSCEDLVRGEDEKRRREEREQKQILDYYNLACKDDAVALLGFQEGADQDQVKAAYQALRERFDPSRFLRNVQVAMKEELQIIEARLIEAFLAVRCQGLGPLRKGAGSAGKGSTPNLAIMALRKELTKTEKQSVEEERLRLADQFIVKAREYWKVNDFFNCLRYCEFSISHNPNAAEAHGLLGQALARNPDYRWQKRAENSLLRATELEPFSPAHWMNLGEFYRSHGLVAKARKSLEKALAILPSHAEARRALESLLEKN